MKEGGNGIQLRRQTGAGITAVLILLIISILIPHPVWNILLITLGGALLLSFIWVWLLQQGLAGQRFLQANWIAIGDVLVEQFEIENQSWLPVVWLEVVDGSNVPGYRPSFVVNMGPRRVEQWRQASVCTRRGRYRLGPWSLRFGDPFGFFEGEIHYSQQSEIIIHPPVLDYLPVSLPAGHSDGQIPRRLRSWQAQNNAATVRRYQPDDPNNRIHWPTTARRDAFFVRQFEQDAAGELWLLLDLSFYEGQTAVSPNHTPNSAEETAVLLAATLTAQALQQRRPIGLIAYGRNPQIVPPGLGKNQSWRLLEALATVAGDAETDLGSSLRDVANVVRRGTAVLIITPTTSATWLPDLIQLQNHAVFASVGLLQNELAERQSDGLKQKIEQLGVVCQPVSQQALARRAAQRRTRRLA
ncbi:MAG: DUF58 domain-containing protein [Chloroflexota bacterium]